MQAATTTPSSSYINSRNPTHISSKNQIMESHMNSSYNQMPGSHDQESGWSAYVDDFPLMNQTEDTYYCSNPSLVSDAAWTGSFGHKNTDKVKKPSSKNQRSNRKKYFWQNDDDLEDTACSPANSPKVIDHTRVFHYIVFQVFEDFILW